MPTYAFRCKSCGDYERWHSIHAPLPKTCPTCGGFTQQVISPPRLYAVGERGAHTRATDATEAQWAKDMPAYKRLRNEGHQPQAIDGAAHLEATAEHGMEINSKGIVKGPEHRIQEGIEMAREIMGGQA